MNFGTTEILLIVAVLFLLFGATRLPQLAKSLGQSRKAFKDGMREAEEEEDKAPKLPTQLGLNRFVWDLRHADADKITLLRRVTLDLTARNEKPSLLDEQLGLLAR